MSTVITVVNQKGGVGKTTTAVNLAACMAQGGQHVLLVDLDSQCNATLSMGLPKTCEPSGYDCLTGRAAMGDVISTTGFENLWVVPGSIHLAGASVELPTIEGWERTLRRELDNLTGRFPVVVVDCPPSLGPLTVVGLCAADRLIVPVQSEYLALEGVAQLLETVDLVRTRLNPELRISGLVLTMHDPRTRLSQDIEREVRGYFSELVFNTVIPRNVRIGEAPSYGKPVIEHDRYCAGAQAYVELTGEVMSRG